MSVRVHLCGRLQVEWNGDRLEGTLPGRQGRLLFAFLTLHRERLVRRDELVEALWSEDGAPLGGDALLRPPLSRLRSALGPGRLEGRAELAIRFPDDTWIDREAVRDGLRASRMAEDARAAWDAAQEALAIAERGLLPGLDARWLGPFRAELDEHRTELLEAVALAGTRLGGGELAEAEQAARRAVEFAPFRESARVALLEVLRRRGNVAEALVAFDELRTFLREELGTSPGRELLALHEELLHAEPAPAQRVELHREPPPRRLPDRLAQALGAPWVGREAALARVREEADRAAAGDAGLVLVVGEGGIGKTRLVAELAAGLEDWDVLYGRCDEEELFPYGAWVDMLRPRLERMGDAELAAVLGPESTDLARLVPEIRERLPDVRSVARSSDPETERRLLFVAVTRVVGRLARQRPLLLVVDDLHWADRSSLLLGRHLAREPRLGRVLLVGTFRDTELDPGHPLPDLIADVERDRPVPRIRLGGMDEREVAALIGSWHGAEVEDDAVRAIRTETEGNPFFVKQLVRHLEEAGGDGRLAIDDELGVPEGVRAVIARRVARLPEGAGHVLSVAALIGRDFEYDLLERVTDLPADALLDVLDAAVRAALLAEVPRTPGRYSFAHALLRSTMESDLTATRRALLHRRIGEAIVERHPDRVDDLARHFAEAGRQEVDRAVDYAVRAAAQASDRLAHDEAVRLLERAVTLRRGDVPVDEAEVARLETALARAEADAGRWEAARVSFIRAAEAAREAETGAAFARAALGHAGGTFEQYGRDDAAGIALLEEALDRLPPGDSRLRAQVLARLAVLRYHRNTPPREVVEPADAAVAIARRLDDPDALVTALGAALYSRWRPGRAAERIAVADELIALAEARASGIELAEAHLWRMGALLELCRLDEAATTFARYDELAGQVQEFQLLIHRDAMRTMFALLHGDLQAAAVLAEEVSAWGERSGPDGAQMPLLLQYRAVHRILLLHERDGLGAMVPFAERMKRESRGLPGWQAPLAWCLVQADRAEEGRAELERLSADGFAALPQDINFVPAMAFAAHAIGQLQDAELAARAEPLLEPFRDLWVVFGIGGSTLGPVAYSLGVLQLVQDRAADAVTTFELALERSERMRARPYVARSRAGLAAALRRRGGPGDAARAEELSALAAADARELGMSRLLRELGLGPVRAP